MEPMSVEDLALLEVLQQIDQSEEVNIVETEIRTRLIDSALIEETGDGLRLTPAGIAMTKSLQHRLSADKLAEKALESRES